MKTNGRSFLAGICLSAFIIGFLAPRVSAQIIVPVSQTRTISASFQTESAGSTNVSASAADFGVFNQEVDAVISGYTGGRGSQNSVINSATITASGSAFGGFHQTSGPQPNNSGTGYSDFSVTFNLSSSCLFALGGSLGWTIDTFGSSAPTVNLSSTNGTVFHLAGFNFGSSGTVPFSTNGVLPSGQYTLTAHAQALGGHFENESYSLTFSVSSNPCTEGECQTGLLGYWTFDEGSGSTAGDSSTNLNTGAIIETGSNSISWVGGVVGGALRFDNQTQVIVSNAPSLNPFTGITISAWVKADYWGSSGYAPRVLEKGASDNQYALLSTPSGQLEFLLPGVSNGVLVGTAPTPGSWHLMSGTYNGSLMILYIDGQIVAQQPASGFLMLTSDALAIGSAPSGGASNMFSGSLDDVRVYGHALSGAEIAQLYNTDSVGDGIPNWWRQQYFGTGSSTGSTSCVTCDFDGTGQNNLFKYIAGLDPTNPSSAFKLNVTLISSNVTAGLVANYPFDGSLTNDASGNGHTGIAVGGVTLTSDRFGNANSALHCDGTSGYIRVPTQLTSGNPFTWSVWFRPGSTATNLIGDLLNEGGNPGQGQVSPGIWINFISPPTYHPGTIDFYWYGFGNGTHLLSQTRAQWDTNAWYHVAVTSDSSGNRCLYINGVCEATDSGQQFGQGNLNFYIGATASYSQDYFLGDIDDVRVYNRGLSAQEIQQLYASEPVTQPRVQFSPVLTGRTYTPQFKTDLVSGIWLPLAFTGPVTNGNQATITDTNAAQPVKFYRIDISKP